MKSTEVRVPVEKKVADKSTAAPKTRKRKVKHMCKKCKPLHIMLDEPLKAKEESVVSTIVLHSTGTHPDILLSRMEAMPYHIIITPGGRLFTVTKAPESYMVVNIALVGGLDDKGNPADTRTEAQNYALLTVLTYLTAQFPDAKVKGADELYPCSYPNPGFNITEWLSNYIPAFLKAA